MARLLGTVANSSTNRLSAGSGDVSYTSGDDSGFDTSMVIILAVLLCSLIFALGLNIAVARCGLPCIFRNSSSSPELTGSTPGMKKRALRKLPEAVYGLGSEITECPICLGEFVDRERIRVLPRCSHHFHVGCIDTWLKSHASCPNCRLSLLEPPPPSNMLPQ